MRIQAYFLLCDNVTMPTMLQTRIEIFLVGHDHVCSQLRNTRCLRRNHRKA